MRLLFCRNCTDLKKITNRVRFCTCRKTFAYEKRDGMVRYGGVEASILGLPREEVEIMRGPASAAPEYVLHKLVVVAPTTGRAPASTLEYVG